MASCADCADFRSNSTLPRKTNPTRSGHDRNASASDGTRAQNEANPGRENVSSGPKPRDYGDPRPPAGSLLRDLGFDPELSEEQVEKAFERGPDGELSVGRLSALLGSLK